MSQQHTTQASGQGMLERVFKLREHGTTARTEVIAGLTTFLTMVYIVFVNPQILGVAGMDTSAVFVTTCLIAAFGSIMMGLFANLPVALAPAMGLNAFFAFVVVQAMGLPWQVGMGAIFWGAIGLLLLTIFRVRYWMIANIPVSDNGRIRVSDLPEHLFTEQATDDVSATRLSTSLSFAEVEKEAIINAAQVTGGRIQEMSALLGIGRTTLWRKMKQHGIDAGQFKRRV